MDARHPPRPEDRPARTVAQQRGDAGEDAALRLLLDAGLRLVARNARFKVGELDLVMLDGATLVFVEVRRRRGGPQGDALDSLDRPKLRRLLRAAEAFRQRQPRLAALACRFDVVALGEDLAAPRWLRGAFRADDVG